VYDVYRARLRGQVERKASIFRTSVKDDERIFEIDIDGTEAHEIMLYEEHVLTREELKKILSALEKLRIEKRDGRIELDLRYEDIHELIEGYVINEVGLEIGGKIHTGRSRNDQVALDIRMSLRSDHILTRNLQRIQEGYERVNLCPLGAGPIGGTSIRINRSKTSSLLGFKNILENSIDAISSRDFILEAASIIAITMSELSRIAEDIVLWSSSEFGYMELDDKYASVSSIMPQKKNPDILELIRGKTSKVYGNLMGLLTIVKGLTTGYSTDLQETKPLIWESIDTLKSSLEIFTDLIKTLKINKERIECVLSESYAFAVDLAEHITEKTDLSFREAHIVVGSLVREMITKGIKSTELKRGMIEIHANKILQKKISLDETDIKESTDPKIILQRRKSFGGPSQIEVERMLKARKIVLKKYKRQLKNRLEVLNRTNKELREAVNEFY